MGNKQGSVAVLPSYEQAVTTLTGPDVEGVRNNFRELRWVFRCPTESLRQNHQAIVSEPDSNSFELCLCVLMWTVFCCSGGRDAISIDALPLAPLPNAAYLKKHVIPKLFMALDYKKDGVIDYEEYISAIALLRKGAIEEKAKC